LAYNGSSIHTHGGELYMKDCKITNNFAGSYGSVFVNNDNSTFVNCVFEGNRAQNNGGCIYSNVPTPKGKKNKAPRINVIHTMFGSNTAGLSGAAIYSNGTDVRIESSEFSDNLGTAPIDVYNGNIAIKDCKILSSPGPTQISPGTEGTLRLDTCSATIEKCTILGNNMSYQDEGNYSGTGSGITLYNSDVILNDTKIDGNVASGASVRVGGSSDLIMNDGSVPRNMARYVYFCGGRFNGNGAGISISKEAKVTLNGVILEGNHADGFGGAIVNSGTLTLMGRTIISGNTANQGAGIDNRGRGIFYDTNK
jgi:predicted outer membrane repeat protein